VTLLSARGLSVSIAGIAVCEALDVDIGAGTRWAVLGRNGSGKTTLLRTLAGLHAPGAGEILLDGVALAEWPRRALARRSGMLFQEQDALFTGTVLETVLIGRHPYIEGWRGEDAEDIGIARSALAEVGLAGMEGRGLGTLSGGERQRLAMAMLLCQDPALYLLDEPTNHLDPHQQIALMDILCRRPAGGAARTAVMVLHDVNLAVRYCDHALLLFGEGDVAVGETARVINPDSLARLYGHRMFAVRSPRGEFFHPE